MPGAGRRPARYDVSSPEYAEELEGQTAGDEAGTRADPIFAAIERHRKAEEEFGSFMNFTDTVWYEQQVEAGPAPPRTPSQRRRPIN